MGRGRTIRAVLAAAATLVLAACGTIGSAAPGAGAKTISGKVGVILPDTTSSTRWESADRPFLTKAFDAAGVGYDIRNAKGDKTKFVQYAEDMLNQGIDVLLMASLDSTTGAAVIRKAAQAGVPVIDYDRLTLAGGAKYYVSFDNVAVGRAIGQGLVQAMQAVGKRTGNVLELNGSPTDNNASLFRQGYDQVIKAAGYTVTDSQPVPDWDNAKAVTVFQQMYTKAGGAVDGVASANDGLGGAALSVLQRDGRAGKVLVTGQDATDEGLQRVLLGTQAVTVYKAIKLEAQAAAKLAIALSRGDTSGADALASATVRDPDTGIFIKSVLLPPRAIVKSNVRDVVADGFTSAARLCTTAQLKQACQASKVS